MHQQALEPPTGLPPAGVKTQKVTNFWIARLSVYWFATSFKWFLILVFLLPDQVAAIIPGGEKSAYWGAVFGAGAIWAVIGPALFGDFSDRTGDRRPFILAGSFCTVGALAVLYYAPTIWVLAIGYLFLQVSDDLSTGPYSALLPELVPEDSRGRASGIMGSAMSLSQVAAVLVALAVAGNRPVLYVLMAVLNVWAAFMVVRMIERGKPSAPKPFLKGWATPWKHADFRWVWFTRFFATLAFYFVIPYANFYIRDMLTSYDLFGIRITSIDVAVGVLALTIALASAVVSFVTGPLIDRLGRKVITYSGAAIMAFSFLCMIALPTFNGMWALAILLGFGYGAFQSANWAMASDVLPEREGLGRDMGIWQMSISSVQIVAGAAGLIVTFGNRLSHGAGYQLLFGLATVAVLAGGALAHKVRSSK